MLDVSGSGWVIYGSVRGGTGPTFVDLFAGCTGCVSTIPFDPVSSRFAPVWCMACFATEGTSQWPRVGAHRIRNPSSRVSDPKKGRKVDETKDQGEHPVHPERSWSMLVRRTVETS